MLGLINRVRNDASLEDIRSYLGDRIGGARLERTLDLAQDYDKIRRLQQSARRQSALDVKRLSDDPLLRVPSRPWTTITDDDGFVSHLLSLWLAWSAPFFNWVDTELFLNDMKSGKGDSGFCSPFLVNAILAQGCVSSPVWY